MEGTFDQPTIEEIGITPATTGNFLDGGDVSQSNPSQYTCVHTTTGRNLVVCIDGVPNHFGEKSTSVFQLHNLVLNGVEDGQRTYYNSGIGTYVLSSRKSLKFLRQVLRREVDLAFVWSFKKTVLAAYRWLAENYEPGDCIFLFGFSLGAYQVRVLSAMIDKVGLIQKENELQIPLAYELYADAKSEIKLESVTEVGLPKGEKMEKTAMSVTIAEKFKKAFSHENVKVHFVGAWDTVSSIGPTRRIHELPRIVDGMEHVCYFRHALALDERRVQLLPQYAYGGYSKPPQSSESVNPETHPSNHGNKSRSNSAIVVHHQSLEVWFAGTHLNIGGMNLSDIGVDCSRPPLEWMVSEARALGLCIAPFESKLSRAGQIEVKETLTPVLWLLELLPLKRFTYTRRENGVLTTRAPHFGLPRKIQEGQRIHSSFLLIDRLTNGQPYRPKAHPVGDDSRFWQTAREEGLGDWQEPDTYKHMNKLVKQFVDTLDVNLLQIIHQTASWPEGQRRVCKSLYGELINALENIDYDLKKKYQLLHLATVILKKSTLDLKESHSTRIRNLVLQLFAGDRTSEDWKVANAFLVQCTYSLEVLHGHSEPVTSVAISRDGKQIASGSLDNTICIWDLETRKQIREVKGHTAAVWSVAFSPDGKHVVSGSADKSVWIWNLETWKGEELGDSSERHIYWVTSVAFSPDGKSVVSGSRDQTIRIWDWEARKLIGKPLMGHTDYVRSVAFSPDGTRLASGSDDGTICIWNPKTGMQVVQPFTGSPGVIWSVAFSPDGMYIVSGSIDKTIQIWNANNGDHVGGPFIGHRDTVLSVAFSGDGRRVVSGSADSEIRAWDAKTGRQVKEPFTKHTGHVLSVAFSPDNRHIISGSHDKTIRIMDVDMYPDSEIA